jgi:hypothetical protein
MTCNFPPRRYGLSLLCAAGMLVLPAAAPTNPPTTSTALAPGTEYSTVDISIFGGGD